jgi:serine/threonine-protein kinase
MGGAIGRPSDIFAASAVLWEALVGARLFKGDSEGEVIKKVLDAQVERPSKLVPELPAQLDAVVLRGLARDPAERFATAREMARALEKCMPMAPTSEVGEFVEKLAATTLAQRAARMAEIESSSTSYPRRSEVLARPTGPESLTVAIATGNTPLGGARPGGAESMPPTSPNLPRADNSQALRAIVSEPVASPPTGALSLLGTRQSAIRRVVAVTIVLACALLLVALGASLRTSPERRAVAAPLSPPPRLEAPPGPVDEAPASEPAPPETAAAPAASMEPPAASVAPAKGVAPAKAVAGSVQRPARRRASCDPPFTVDANGSRHSKLECAE